MPEALLGPRSPGRVANAALPKREFSDSVLRGRLGTTRNNEPSRVESSPIETPPRKHRLRTKRSEPRRLAMRRNEASEIRFLHAPARIAPTRNDSEQSAS